jgi:hypothetical protein
VQVTVPAAGGAPPPSVAVDVFRGEKSIATAGVRWGAPEPGGLCRHVAEIPVGTLEPGAYEVRASLSDGSRQRLIKVPFSVSP